MPPVVTWGGQGNVWTDRPRDRTHDSQGLWVECFEVLGQWVGQRQPQEPDFGKRHCRPI